MTSYRKKVVSVKPITTEREIEHEVNKYKSGAMLEFITIERITNIYVYLECGHTRQQYNGMRDITKSKTLECRVCQKNYK